MSVTAPQTPLAELSSLRDLSVDELFEQHLVRLIQTLFVDYKAQVQQAKEGLHKLVGEKYRDLIRIAEDVNQMSLESSQIDIRLTDLSYRHSNHVQFGSCPTSNFDAKFRASNAKHARESLQTTILNNIINNKLIGFDLKLKTNAVPSTAALVHLAKLYHTVSTAFETTLCWHPHIALNFEKLRFNFVTFLEEKMACYSSNAPIGDIALNNLLLHSSLKRTQQYSLDFVEVSFDEDDFEEPVEWDHLGMPSLDIGFVPQSLRITNLFVAYIIVTCTNRALNSTKKLAERFIFLRHAYFSKQLNTLMESKHDHKDINFLAIFSFIENTSLLLGKYLIGTGFNDIKAKLLALRTWDPADILGFHNWIDMQLVSLPIEEYSSLADDFLGATGSLLVQFARFIADILSQIVKGPAERDAEPLDNLTLLYVLVASLRKVEVLCHQIDLKSSTVAVLSETQLLSTFLKEILKSVGDLIKKHQQSLIDQVLPLVDPSLATTCNQGPFTLDFVSAIDIDVTTYITSVIEVASVSEVLQSHGNAETVQGRLKLWFSKQRYLLGLILEHSEVREMLQLVYTRSYADCEKFRQWGDFTLDSVLAQFGDLSLTLTLSLLEKLSKFQKAFKKRFSLKNYASCMDDVYFPLNINLILRKNLSALALLSSEVQKGIDVEVVALFKKLFDSLMHTSADSLQVLSDPSIMDPSQDDQTIPAGPHLFVYSMMNHLATKMFESSVLSETELYTLFLDDTFRAQFVAVKSKWILSQLVTKIELDKFKYEQQNSFRAELDTGDVQGKQCDLSGNGAGELDSAKKDPTSEPNFSTTRENSAGLLASHARQLFANVVFLVQFTLDGALLSKEAALKEFTEKIRAASVKDALEDSAIESILRAVSSFYQSGKETYIPLLLT
ncbi:hypothetical protein METBISCDRAFT_27301 [Metschnikowia bicuspidata]|uniref:Uncharacterized protein n=1 Tax=Metschnikowia bicuspidata TaxID=27322 RepID=A0A4P9ZCE8_9ASCO|nr:hypothetical protein METBISCDRAFT_27301 [Metschnikowia bicuspidata]